MRWPAGKCKLGKHGHTRQVQGGNLARRDFEIHAPARATISCRAQAATTTTVMMYSQ
jgi:hypothetical protein